MFKLSKSFIGIGTLRIGTLYVTNGHWAVARSVLHASANALTLTEETTRAAYPRADVRTLPDSAVESLLGTIRSVERVAYTRTPWMRCEGSIDAVLFLSADGGQWWCNREYADAFDLQVVYAPAVESGKVSLDAATESPKSHAIIVMPYRTGGAVPGAV